MNTSSDFANSNQILFYCFLLIYVGILEILQETTTFIISSAFIYSLYTIKPFCFQEARFITCHASIVDFDFSKGWWYPSYPKCNKKRNGSKNN